VDPQAAEGLVIGNFGGVGGTVAAASAAVAGALAPAAVYAAFEGRARGRVRAHPYDDVRSAGGGRVLATVGSWKVARKLAPKDAEPLLARCGWDMSSETFRGLSLVAASIGLTFGLTLPWPGPVLAPLVGEVGRRGPAIVANRAASRRLKAIDAAIPHLLDLLAAASSSGLSGSMALRRATEAVAGPLSEELNGVFQAVDMGGRWREELEGLSQRLGLADFHRVVIALSRTEALGASLSASTSDLAASVREARRARTLERARTAPIKMLFPLVFLVLPAFLLLTVVPVLLSTLHSLA
jgi:Flp pilus assembly protein TadB